MSGGTYLSLDHDVKGDVRFVLAELEQAVDGVNGELFIGLAGLGRRGGKVFLFLVEDEVEVLELRHLLSRLGRGHRRRLEGRAELTCARTGAAVIRVRRITPEQARLRARASQTARRSGTAGHDGYSLVCSLD